MTGRDEVLRRIRAARGALEAPVPIPRDYRQSGEYAAGAPELIAQLVDRLEDYRAVVVRTGSADAEIGAAIASLVSERGLTSVIVPDGLAPQWIPSALAVRVDDGSAGPDELDAIDAVLTGSAVAISETGTIVLDGGPVSGRRAITLVPDTHICVVVVGDVVQTVPEGLRLLDPVRPLTFISGPSATSDIELNRVEGVHGPRNLIVVLAG